MKPIDWEHQGKIENENKRRELWIKAFVSYDNKVRATTTKDNTLFADKALEIFDRRFYAFDYKL